MRDELVSNVSPVVTAARTELSLSETVAPSFSKLTVSVPLSEHDYPMRLKYRTVAERVRVGRVLEDLDTMAGIVSYRHNTHLTQCFKLKICILNIDV